ncbi:MAG: hypothetical protein MUP17_02100 [candidate division Zixibacteria bacterium]|nr:hypothetical protein [candidate division Zixibacteria bacterium]
MFQPLYDHPLKEEDALEIIFSVTEYFETLIGIDSQRTLIEEEKCEHDTG